MYFLQPLTSDRFFLQRPGLAVPPKQREGFSVVVHGNQRRLMRIAQPGSQRINDRSKKLCGCIRPSPRDQDPAESGLRRQSTYVQRTFKLFERGYDRAKMLFSNACIPGLPQRERQVTP